MRPFSKSIFLFIFCIFTPVFSQPLPDLPEKQFGQPLNTQNDEYNPIISPDGRFIVFQSNRPGGEGGMDLWISENVRFLDKEVPAEWTKPVNMNQNIREELRRPPVPGVRKPNLFNSNVFEGGVSILFDSNNAPSEIYFTSTLNPTIGRSGFEGLNIYRTIKDKKTGRWTDPEHLSEINSNFNEKMPAISPDGNFLIFSSDRPGGYGDFDLWISVRNPKNGSWSQPKNLGSPLNSSESEILPFIHQDGEQLYFSSNREDEGKKFKIFRIFLKYKSALDDMLEDEEETEEILKPKQIETPIPKVDQSSLLLLPKPFNTDKWEVYDNEGISFDKDGIWAYISSNRAGGEGQFDIYRFQVPESLRNSYILNFKGLVLDGSEKTMIGLDSTLKIYDGTKPANVITSKRIGGDLTKGKLSNFATTLQTGRVYKVEISSPGFHPQEDILDLRGNIGKNRKIYRTYVLLPIQIGEGKAEETKTEPADNQKPNSAAMKVIVADASTKQVIPDAKVTLFTPTNRKGESLVIDKKSFLINRLPESDFELFATAPKYISESINIIQKNIPKNGIVTIYLRAENDVNPIYNLRVYFEFNKTKITNENKKLLDPLVDYLLKNASDKIEIGGHTDNVASKEYNTRLSAKRARNVYEYFLSKGISEKRMKIRAYWYSQPDADNETEIGRAKNRRVSFRKL
ncbi:OmpA family protein [Leptospira borgpetersenii]|uniref:OmpA family protein n=1 Tax=Leptospira borgpetersenii TaxID=174 RepID=UPI0007744F61|nr:OmpA family protein [Leptospira borgpetersenii]MBE8399934.1 PD40 domain-containing protein [Leptospira borgpetersenii serovar Tarassovi]MBE8402767.1 PD40 domain-containing protein [Leptospira borgpetersenii serovar Tarassovi]MBE8406264.1 PD40 domain-containing protein [Leptospira borgpetersenii serovar Tarassovi]MBE8413663.1 PD40 domain-containing protein [Leptospira borgpetersenii serovar Tarassovi]MBE8416020.1 PD40 domain-containing protein [Leptospira borgpetersenii serovar Tarassovi]